MDEIVRLFLEQVGARLDPMVAAFLARLLRFFEERMRAMTALYEEQTRNVGREVQRVIHDESSRLVAEGFKSLGRGLWQLVVANGIISVILGIALVIGLFYYGRYRWRKFFWERRMLHEAREQNRLTQESRDAILEQNELLRRLLSQRNGVKPEAASGDTANNRPE